MATITKVSITCTLSVLNKQIDVFLGNASSVTYKPSQSGETDTVATTFWLTSFSCSRRADAI